MALTNPYCTTAQVAAECRNSNIDATVLEHAVNHASRIVDDLCGRTFFQHSFTAPAELRICACDKLIYGTQLWLPRWPIIDLASVTAGGVEWVEDTDFITRDGRVLVSLVGDWPESNDPTECVLVEGDFGYAQDAETDVPDGIPEAVTRATIMLAANLTGYNQKDVLDQMGMRQTLTERGVPKDALKILGKWATNGGFRFTV